MASSCRAAGCPKQRATSHRRRSAGAHVPIGSRRSHFVVVQTGVRGRVRGRLTGRLMGRPFMRPST
jgi:hypothetical protein